MILGHKLARRKKPGKEGSISLRVTLVAEDGWFMPVILVTQEAEIRRV
jgi:hypothetical protein